MSESRAYTYIDHARAAVGNPWIERVWSALDGRTSSLVLKPVKYDWVAGFCPEFEVTVNGIRHGLDAWPHVEWMEESNPRGATLVVRRTGPALQVITRTFVYHDIPAMVRAQTVFNLSSEIVELTALVHDSLALDAVGVSVYTADLDRVDPAVDSVTADRFTAIVRGELGVFMGREGGGRYRIFAPEAGRCAIEAVSAVCLEPHEASHLPRTYLSFFIGPVREAAGRSFATVLADLEARDDRMPDRSDT